MNDLSFRLFPERQLLSEVSTMLKCLASMGPELNHHQAGLLILIHGTEPASFYEEQTASTLEMSRSGLSRALSRLEDLNLIVRQQCVRDKRRKIPVLTGPGEDWVQELVSKLNREQ